MASTFLRSIRVMIWAPEPGPESALGAFFGPPPPNALVVEGLRVTFTIERDDKTTANTAEVQIYNLNQSEISGLSRIPLRLSIEAGYGSEMGVIFVGDVTLSPGTSYDGTDRVTTLQAKDGGRAIKHARVNRSIRSATKVYDVVREAIAAMGLQPPANLAQYAELQRQYAHGTVLYGTASDTLTRLLPAGMSWSIQNGKMVIARAADVTSESVLVVDEAAGLIGHPELALPSKAGEKPTMTLRCFLYPDIAPRRIVRVQSSTVNGEYRVVSVRHTGDTHAEGDMMTEVEGKLRST
jgi:hypothetical protein